MKQNHTTLAVVIVMLLAAGYLFSRRSHRELQPAKKSETSVTKQESPIPVGSKRTEGTTVCTQSTNISMEDLNRIAAEQSQVLATRMGVTPDMTPDQVRQKAFEWYRAQAGKLVPEQKPVQFFGKAVDEKMQPISGGAVHFIWSDASKPNGTSEADAVSGDDGSFSLTSGTGSRVNIYVTKDGYYEVKSLNGFDFDVTGDGSSPVNPVLFHFRKKGPGADLVTSQYGVYPDIFVTAPRDGTPMRLDFVSRKVGQDGQLEVSQRKPDPQQFRNAGEFERNLKEWSFQIAVPDGGLTEQHDEFPFEAPALGYQRSIEFKFDRDSTNWISVFKKDFYVVFGQPPKYGRIHVETGPSTPGARIEYAINPDGSRYLEPK